MAERTTAAAEHILTPDVESVMWGLFRHAEDKLSDSELKNVALLREEAETMIGNVASLTMGIGSLVASDADHSKSHARAGNFQSAHDVAELLWSISGQINAAKAMLNVSSWADEAIERRRALKAGGSRTGAHRG